MNGIIRKRRRALTDRIRNGGGRFALAAFIHTFKNVNRLVNKIVTNKFQKRLACDVA
jgi:hypothetical protein